MEEKVYKIMNGAGTVSITVGIVTLATGVACGIMMIIAGAKLLAGKSKGEVSKLFHISVSSLRHYENVGLLLPEYTSPDTGYRYYGPEQFEVLNTIRYLRALDMPLADYRNQE